MQARQLIAWKQSSQPLTVAELTDEDKRILESNRRARLVEIVQKHCSAALKTIMQHKVGVDGLHRHSGCPEQGSWGWGWGAAALACCLVAWGGAGGPRTPQIPPAFNPYGA